MKGQWIGRTLGDQVGKIIINVDDHGDYFSGVGFTFPDDKKFPVSVGIFRSHDKSKDFTFPTFISPVDPTTGLPTEWKNIEQHYPGISHSKNATVSGHFEANELFFNIKTDIGVKFESHITRKPFSECSDLSGETKIWDEYKKHVASLSEKEYLFRGQTKPWKLRTAFHRKGRYDLFRFLAEDIPKLHRRLTARTRHVFNLEIPNENGAFFNLAQHHGYPTPLLDWTFSPYVAAFFAFRNVPKNSKSDECVRIFVFDQQKWRSDWTQITVLNNAWPHFSIMEFLAIDNERLVPQQAATTVTNIDDVETYIFKMEQEKNFKYLSAIDIHFSERNKVIKELSYMGITAGSMFPGLDGSCEELREKLFDE
jgi:hypothetical protein